MMPFTTIRSTLLALLGSLGVVILVLTVLQFSDLVVQHSESQRRIQANIALNDVARAALSLARERDSTFLTLATGAVIQPETAAETNRILAAQSAKLAKPASGNLKTDTAKQLSERLSGLRLEAASALTLPLLSQPRKDAALRWFDAVTKEVAALRAFRLQLLDQKDMGPETFGLYYLRTQTLILLDELMRNATLLEVEVAFRTLKDTAGTFDLSGLDTQVAKAAFEVEISIQPFAELISSLGNQGVGPGVARFDTAVYVDAEQRLRQALQSGDQVEDELAHWRRVSEAAILQLDELQAATFGIVQDRAAGLASDTRRSIVLWALVLAISATIVIVAVRVVIVWVVAPLEQMRGVMLQLAEDNLSVSLPKRSRLKEISAMDDALRVFKSNAVRRQTLQCERYKLHGRLEETYSRLKSDLEAAAVIQASLMPQQAQMGNVSFSSYFRPSHFLAGDTFDILNQPDGRVILFQIDVAGHGAAAALVSVASKYTIAQAILQRQNGSGLAELVHEINREWPSDLPYFTLVLAEIDPSTGQGVLVQAGHPSPLLLRANGDVIVLGDGGLPIGAIAHATYDAIPFKFDLNDRLVIATDGVHEMENSSGQAFSEERVQSILRGAAGRSTEEILAELDASMRAWRGDNTLDDDVSIVVLEGKRVNEHH